MSLRDHLLTDKKKQQPKKKAKKRPSKSAMFDPKKFHPDSYGLMFNEDINEASSAMALDRFDELYDVMKTDTKDKLKEAGIKTQKEAAKIFQQAIKLLKGLK